MLAGWNTVRPAARWRPVLTMIRLHMMQNRESEQSTMNRISKKEVSL